MKRKIKVDNAGRANAGPPGIVSSQDESTFVLMSLMDFSLVERPLTLKVIKCLAS